MRGSWIDVIIILCDWTNGRPIKVYGLITLGGIRVYICSLNRYMTYIIVSNLTKVPHFIDSETNFS